MDTTQSENASLQLLFIEEVFAGTSEVGSEPQSANLPVFS